MCKDVPSPAIEEAQTAGQLPGHHQLQPALKSRDPCQISELQLGGEGSAVGRSWLNKAPLNLRGQFHDGNQRVLSLIRPFNLIFLRCSDVAFCVV